MLVHSVPQVLARRFLEPALVVLPLLDGGVDVFVILGRPGVQDLGLDVQDTLIRNVDPLREPKYCK